jgi:hypothetical protein
MTTLEKLRKAERWRIKGQGGTEADGWNGWFLVPLDGEMYQVIIADGMGWRHLSISNAQKKMLPSWQTMCRVKDLFFGDDCWACQFHPAKADYINDHPWVLHIWQPLDVELPQPPVVMV